MPTTCDLTKDLTVPFLDLKQQYQHLRQGINEAIQAVLDSAQYIQGPKVSEFEHSFAAYCGVKEAVAVESVLQHCI
jgi:UDP-2-acetamido-2-deoxy-ribo-hexuluronate aminotransferase